MKKMMNQKLQLERMKIERYKLKMNYLHPSTKLQEQKHYMAETEQKLRLIMERKLLESKQKLAIQIERMKGLSPLTKLNQGFSYVKSGDYYIIKGIVAKSLIAFIDWISEELNLNIHCKYE